MNIDLDETDLIRFQRQLRAAQGYYELGMLDEAWEEVNAIDGIYREDASVLHVKLLLHLKTRRLEAALLAGQQLCLLAPEDALGFIHVAYCLHEMGDTSAAIMFLETGPCSLAEEPVYHYNMGCYEATLGKIDQAKRSLQRCFEMDDKLLDVARKDPDLAMIWKSE